MSLRILVPLITISGIAFASAGIAGPFPASDSRSSREFFKEKANHEQVSEITGTTTVRSPRPTKKTVSAPSRTKPKQQTVKFTQLIAKHARANGVPVALAHAVVTIESRFNPRARGRAGEVGLMQIKPSTARGIGYKGSIKALYDPETNLRWGMKYLGEAHRRGGGTVCGTILKYNAGHYAKRMNKVSANYCGKVKRILNKA